MCNGMQRCVHRHACYTSVSGEACAMTVVDAVYRSFVVTWAHLPICVIF
jgi:hypothetical protein